MLADGVEMRKKRRERERTGRERVSQRSTEH